MADKITTASAAWLTDPTMFAVNRTPAHSNHVTFSHIPAIGEPSDLKQSLDGEWRVEMVQASDIDLEEEPFAAEDFDDSIDRVILPGGESTTQGKLLRSTGLFEPIAAHIAAGKPVFGTCAGMILLAKRLENDDNVYFGALDATVRRNAYGRQLGSFISTADFGDIKDFPLVFIRGPFVSDVGTDATIETEVDGRVVGLRQGNILATAFHPELTDDTRIHELFLSL